MIQIVAPGQSNKSGNGICSLYFWFLFNRRKSILWSILNTMRSNRWDLLRVRINKKVNEFIASYSKFQFFCAWKGGSPKIRSDSFESRRFANRTMISLVKEKPAHFLYASQFLQCKGAHRFHSSAEKYWYMGKSDLIAIFSVWNQYIFIGRLHIACRS